MQFQPTALILSASAQRKHYDSARLDSARPDSVQPHSARPETARWDVAGFEAARRARPAAPVTAQDHRVRRAVAGLLLRTARAIEPSPNRRVVAHG